MWFFFIGFFFSKNSPLRKGALSADCKRGRRKGATSKNVKNRQKVSKSFSTIFAQGKNVKNRQKVSKSFSTLFDNFRAAPFFRPLLQSADIKRFFPYPPSDVKVAFKPPTPQKCCWQDEGSPRVSSCKLRRTQRRLYLSFLFLLFFLGGGGEFLVFFASARISLFLFERFSLLFQGFQGFGRD